MESIFVISNQSSEHFKDTLKALGYHFIGLPKNEKTYRPVNDHPDLYGTPFPNDVMLLEPQLYEHLHLQGIKLDPKRYIRGEKAIGARYPETCFYNYLVFSNVLIGNETYCIPQVIKLAKKSGLKTCHVKQAYVRCTTCFIGEKYLLTSDKGIFNQVNKMFEKSLESSLWVDPSDIVLSGFPNGFIGGSLVRLRSDLYYFNGALSEHRQSNEIKNLMKLGGVDWIENPKIPLTDMGSALKINV